MTHAQPTAEPFFWRATYRLAITSRAPLYPLACANDL